MTNHFSIFLPERIVKSELKAPVIGKLVEIKVIVVSVFPEQMEPAELDGAQRVGSHWFDLYASGWN